ncbi:hypothetical protein NHQ30_004115 [Ciborinia camelliae]|nr:hypothetical protein NHQ30_004115 [Ciborinia camelliae]
MRVRQNIVTAFVLEKEKLVAKFKDDIAKHQYAIEGGRDERGLKAFGPTDRELSIVVKEDAREKKDAKELESLWCLRGPNWLSLLQLEDIKNGPREGESEEETERRERRLKEERDRRDKMLLKELEGHKSEEYEWNPKDFHNPGSRCSSPEPDSEEERERDSEGDVLMGNLYSADASRTRLCTPANTITPYDIEHKFDMDLQRLLEDGIKKLKEYDQHAEKVLAKYKQDLAKAIISGLEMVGAGAGMLKSAGAKTQSISSPSESVGNVLKRKSASIESPSDTPIGILKRSASIQSPSENGGNTPRKSVSIQTPSENNGRTLKKSASIQIPSGNQSGSYVGSPLVQSPSEYASSALKKVRLDAPFGPTPASSSPMSTNPPIFQQQFPFPMNAPTGPAKSSPVRRPSNLFSVPQSPPTPNAPTGFNKEPIDPNGYVGITFKSTTTWARNPRHYFNLEILSGDEIKVTNYVLGSTYEGLNMTSQQTGRLDIKFYLKDIKKIAKAPIARSTEHPMDSSDVLSQYDGSNDDTMESPKNTAPHVGKTFISSMPCNLGPRSVFNLEIRPGDEIKITKHANGNEYEGFNINSRKTGLFNIIHFLEDIEPTGHIGKTFISSSNYTPIYGDFFFNLKISIDDKVKVLSHHSRNAYIGLNMTSNERGNFNINFYLEDIKSADNARKVGSSSGPKYDHTNDDPTLHVGKTFTATNTWGPRHRKDSVNLLICIGDKITIEGYISGTMYKGVNETTEEVGQVNMEYFWKDIEHSSLKSIDQTSTGTSTQRSKNSIDATIVRTDVSPKDGHSPKDAHGSIDRPALHIGKTFISSHSWVPRREDDLRRRDELEIRSGDEIQIIGYKSKSLYEGFNVRTRDVGQFDINYFWKDIDPRDNIGRIFVATSTLHIQDITYLRIRTGDNIRITKLVGNGVYIGHNLSTGEKTGRFPADQFQDDIVRPNFIGRIFTATSTQNRIYDSDHFTLVIALGDKIEITKFISGGAYRGLNMRTRQEGQFQLGDFWKDVDAASGSLDDHKPSRMDIDPVGTPSTPTNAPGVDNQPGKVSFSIKKSPQKLPPSNAQMGVRRFSSGMPIVTGGEKNSRVEDHIENLGRRDL